MVMATTTDRPIRLSDMTREEAETVTDQIKENFDSLGNMLIAARDRKAFRVLGYRTFETYCQTEFGKSSSTAYQAIEDAKIRSQLEAHISENQGEKITLNFPSSHLRPLKGIENIEDKLKAIKYAQKLAARDGKRATKQHLEIAVFELSGKRSEEFRSAIQKLGFTRGTEVETLPPHKKERGIVRSIDKLGKVHVELFYGSIKHIEYDATQLRILTNEEKPANPLDGSVAKKDDRVLIYSEGLQGKQGTIYTWKEGKQALVMVDGETGPDLIAYAEMERIKPEQKDTNWEADLSWETAKQTYYYFQKEDKIYSNKWPAGLTLEPHTHELNPIDFMVNWEENFAGQLLEGLITPTNLKTLVLAQAIELPEAEGKEFAADLITSLLQLFPQVIPESSSTLAEENQRLLIQLAESETAIQSMIATSTAPPLELEQTIKSLIEDAASTENPDRDNNAIIAAKREGIEKYLQSLAQELLRTKNEKNTKKIRADIRIQESRREDIDIFATLEIGNSVIRKIYPDRKGIIDKLEISTTGLLSVWVTWPQRYEGEPNSPEEHNVGTLIKISNVDGGEK